MSGQVVSFKDYKAGLSVAEQQDLLAAWMAKDREKHPDEYDECVITDRETGTVYKAGTRAEAEELAKRLNAAAKGAPAVDPDPFEEKQPVQPRFAPLTAGEFAAGDDGIDWLVKGVLPKAELAVIYGDSGSGKSFLTFDMCASLTRGVYFGEHKITQKHRIAYVCAEGRQGFKRRVRAYAKAKQVDFKDLPDIIPEAPYFLDGKDPKALTEQLENKNYDAIVLDTLSAIAPGGDQNGSEDMGAILKYCKEMHRRTGALVVLIHHSGKDAKKGARGWSGLRAAADCEIEVVREGNVRRWTTSKQKDGADQQTFGFALGVESLGFDKDGDPVSSCFVNHGEAVFAEKPAPAAKGKGGNQEAIKAALDKLGTASSDDEVIDLAHQIKTKSKDIPTSDQKRNLKRALKSMKSKEQST